MSLAMCIFNSQTCQQILSTIVETGIGCNSDRIYTKYSLQEFQELQEVQTKKSIREKPHFIVKKKSVSFLMANPAIKGMSSSARAVLH